MTVSLANFYSHPNEVVREGLEEDAEHLLHNLETRLEPPGERTLLPARVDGVSRWYGIASSDRELRILLEEARSWLGPPVSSNIGLVDAADDELDQRVRELIPDARVIRIDINPDWNGRAREHIGTLRDVWHLTPDRGLELPRPVGRVLRQFYESLMAKDRQSCEDAINELHVRQLLSPTNIRFLKVEMVGTLGTPTELVSTPLLESIIHITRPPLVSNHLATAANNLLIEPVLASEDSPEWQAVGQELEESWPGLITHPNQVLSLAGARCLALAESVSTTPRQTVFHSLLEGWGDDAVINAVIGGLQLEEVLETPQTAVGLYHAEEFTLVLDAIETATPDRATAGLALQAALNLGDTDSATRALLIVERLPDTDRTDLLGQAVEGSFHAQLVSRTGGSTAPVGWVDWLTGDWPDRPDLLGEWSTTWEQPSGLGVGEADTLASSLLDALNDERRGRVRNGIPQIVGWLIGEESNLAVSAVPLATTVFDIMLSSEPGRLERTAALDLLDEILLTGCSSEEYSELVAAVQSQFSQIGPRDAPWLSSVLDLLLLSSSPDPSERLAVVSEAFGLVQSWTDRIEDTDIVLLSRVFNDAGLELPVRTGPPTDDPDSRQPIRTFRKVGIYSLLEPAARTAQRWIKEMWPGTDVPLAHDHVNRRPLEALVRSADVMLVQTSRATHAATNAIRDAAPDSSRIVLVNGRGATALLRGLIQWSEGGDQEPLS